MAESDGRLAENILYFARALRAAGIPVGPGAVLDALEALKTAGVGTREDFYWTLHAVFVKRHEHSILFDQAFRIFFRRRGYIDQLHGDDAAAGAGNRRRKPPQAGATRVHEALFSGLDDKLKKEREIELDARLTVSDREVLQKKDFAQMTGAEIAAAKEAMKRLVHAARRSAHPPPCAARARSSHRHPPHAARQHERRRRFHRSEVSSGRRPSRRRSWRCSIFPAR